MSTTYSPPTATGIIEQGDPADDPRAFRRALGQFATGVTVISTSDGTHHVGMAVNSFAAVSLDPPLVSWSIRNESRNRDTFVRNGHFAVSVLADDQVDISALFGRPHENQFEHVAWTAGIHGDRLLDQAIAHFECTLEATHEGGDHVILIGRVKRCTRLDGAPLLFSQGQYGIAEAHPQVELTSAAPSVKSSDAGEESPLFTSLLKATEQHMSSLFDEYRKRLDINVVGSRVVNLLDTAPASAGELSERALLGEAAVEDTLSEFKTRGWVSESADKVFKLTDAGRSVRANLLRSAQEFTSSRLNGIDPSDLDAARRVLIRLLTS
jgi:flavin reductase (DIM6/NTAB) family NADH-FMN oxidoreductase RutF/DNA-binding MarR family transcriptional regulator